MNNGLKPCPFCGGEAHLSNWSDGAYVWCECGVKTEVYLHSGCVDKAIEAWNRRTETALDTLMRVFAYDATCGVCDKRKERTAKVDWMDGDPYCDCGQELRDSFVYCPGCGAKLDWSVEKSQPEKPDDFVTAKRKGNDE